MIVTPEGLRSIREFSINGSCEIMKLFRPAGAEKDRLFLVTKRHHAMILEVEQGPDGSKDFEIVTRAYGDVRDKIGKKSETGTIAVIDPDEAKVCNVVQEMAPGSRGERHPVRSHVGSSQGMSAQSVLQSSLAWLPR